MPDIFAVDEPGRLGKLALAQTLATPLNANIISDGWQYTPADFIIAIISFPAMSFIPQVQLVEEMGSPHVGRRIGIYPHSENFLGALTPISPHLITPKNTGRILFAASMGLDNTPIDIRQQEIKSAIPDVEFASSSPIFPELSNYDILIGTGGITMLDAWACGIPFVAYHRGQPAERGRAQLMSMPYAEDLPSLKLIVDSLRHKPWGPPQPWGLPAVVASIKELM